MGLRAHERRITDAFLSASCQGAQLSLGSRGVAAEVFDRAPCHRRADIVRQENLEPGGHGAGRHGLEQSEEVVCVLRLRAVSTPALACGEAFTELVGLGDQQRCGARDVDLLGPVVGRVQR